jgi:hypothetical protein
MRNDLNIPESALYAYNQMQDGFENVNEDALICEDCGDEVDDLNEVKSFTTVREFFPPLQIRVLARRGNMVTSTVVHDDIKRELRTVRKPCTKSVCDTCKADYDEEGAE